MKICEDIYSLYITTAERHILDIKDKKENDFWGKRGVHCN